MTRLIPALAFLLALALPASAAEVGGVKLADKATVAGSELALNGAGIRSRLVFKVYAMGLYLSQKAGTPQAALEAPGAKRVSIVLMRDLSAQQFVDALNEGLQKNASAAEQEALKGRMAELSQAMLAVGEAKTGTPVQLDWLPDSGTRLSVAGQQRGKDIPGEDFYRALLKIWIGDKPAQDDLKQALLGK